VLYERLKRKLQPRLDVYICLLLALAVFTLYVRTLTPGVLDGDSGEWQYMANILGIPHSTGYPLYVLLAKLVTFLPIGNPAWRVNLFSALCAALTIPVVYLLAKRVARSMGESSARIAAILSASFFALMPSLWASATIAEVYTLNTLLIALTLFFAIRFFDSAHPHDLYLMALCFGLALANHRIAFFIAPALLLVLWLKRSALDIKKIAYAFIAIILPLLLYLYIPLRASQLLAEQSPENWALYPRAEAIVNGKISAYYNPTLAGFFNLITALDNRNKLGFQDASGQDQLLVRLQNAWTLLREQIDPFGIVLAILGIVILLRRERVLALILLAAGGSIAAISLILRAESTRFYFSAAYMVMLLFFTATIAWILAQLNQRATENIGTKDAHHNALLIRLLYLAAIIYFAFFPLTAFYFNFARMDESSNTKYDQYARAVLNDNLAPNSVLIAPWEVATPIRYLQYVENVRPDVLTIHESPVRPQYQKILEAAHQLHRPIYYAQFTPEDKNSDTPRTVQAIAFPLPQKPSPQFVLNEMLNPSIRLLGYDWQPDIANVDGTRFARLAFYYQVLQPVQKEYAAELDFGNIRGDALGSWTHRPVSEYLPTYLWKPGEYYRDVWDIPLTNDAPRGLYNAELTWYKVDTSSSKIIESSAKSVNADALRVGDFTTDSVQQSQLVPFANGMQLLGYALKRDGKILEGNTVTTSENSPFDVELCWQTTRELNQPLTFFVHLVDSSGILRSQADQAPWGGMYPTDRWQINQPVCDTYHLNLASDLPAQAYQLEVGMYSNPEAPEVVRVEGSDQTRVILNTPLTLTAAK